MKDGTVLEWVSLQSPLCQAAVEGPGQLPGQMVRSCSGQAKGQTPLGLLGSQ